MQRTKLGPGWRRGAGSFAPGPAGPGTGVCWFQNKAGLGWHAGARRPSYFPGFVSQAARRGREGNDSHLEAEVQAPKEDHRKAKSASGRPGPRSPGPEPEPAASGPSWAAALGHQPDSEWATRRPVARHPGWQLGSSIPALVSG